MCLVRVSGLSPLLLPSHIIQSSKAHGLQSRNALQPTPAIKEAERTMNSAETAVESKSKEIRELMTDKQRMMAEVSMHKAEKEALIEDRQKLQRQMMAIKADKETMEERLAAYQR
mmetsp:Transcript_31466/g.49244  ORF Transcript_31466/g.49244 Transcript_31466/m.49244 type:complete len:115 (-) Transcript_31466:1572-1916(-)